MDRTERNPIEAEEALLAQLRFLQSSARAYDEGDEDESRRLASVLRVLCHHAPQVRTHALLAQVGLVQPGTARGMHFLDTGELPRPPGTISLGRFKLCAMKVDATLDKGTATFVPVLDGRRGKTSRYRPFDQWWSDVVVETPAGERFSRSRLVLVMANQDGGAHFDPRLDADYHRLTRGGGMGWQVSQEPSGSMSVSIRIDADTGLPKSDEGDPQLNPAPASVRQIAHEMLESLRGRYRKTIAYQPAFEHRPLLGRNGLVEVS